MQNSNNELESKCDGQNGTSSNGAAQNKSQERAKGTGHYPISDKQFDVVALIFEKSKALQAYDKYLSDFKDHQELWDVMQEVAADDRKHVEKLKQFLNCSA